MNLDYYSVFFFLSVATYMVFFVYVAFYILSPTRRKSLLLFAVGKFFQATAVLALTYRGQIPDVLSIEVANLFLILGVASEVSAVSLYLDKFRPRIIGFYATVSLVAMVVFLCVSDNFVYRSSTASFSAFLLSTVVAFDILRGRKTLRLTYVLSVSYFVYGFSRLTWFVELMQMPSDYAPTGLVFINAITLIISAATIVHSVAFVLLLAELDQRNIMQKSKLLSLAFENSPVGIIITAPDGTIEYANSFVSQITGYSVKELEGKNPRILKSDHNPPSLYTRLWSELLATKSWRGEIINRRKNGSHYVEELSIAALNDEQGELEKYVAIKTDISQRKSDEALIHRKTEELERLNEELHRANQVKSQLFSIIAHDLRGPVGSLNMLLDLLATEADMDSEQRQLYMNTASDSARSTYELLENLLHWARNQQKELAFHPTHVSLFDLFTQLIELNAAAVQRKQIDLALMVTRKAQVYGDANTLSVVFRNLLTNAIKFTPDGGKISIRCIEKPDSCELHIQDTGVGISPDRLHSLFELAKNKSTFGTAGEKGTGLGLLLVHDFVQRNNGRLWVESKQAHGSTFFVELPTQAPQQA